MKFAALFTERLILRQLRPGDERAVFVLRSNPVINQFLERRPAESIADAQVFIEKINGSIAESQSAYWAICTNSDDRLIGTICLFDFESKPGSAEIGFELCPEFQGKGFMQEAISSVLAHAFGGLKLAEVTAFSDKSNKKSIKLLMKNGFAIDSGCVDERHAKFILANSV